MPRNSAPLILLLTLTLAACGEDPARIAARKAAHRDWCIAEELAVQANTRFTEINNLQQGSGGALTGNIYPFAKAQFDFAKARERELALLDSAASAPSTQDSTSFARRAAEARPAAPTSEVEQNAADSYTRDFALALGNPAHPCNLEPESER